MKHPWAGRVALVTGAGTGIGAATSIMLAERGACVVGFGLDEEPLTRVGETIRARVGDEDRFVRVVGDVSDPADRQECVRLIERRWGTLDLLVNNAAVFLFGGVEATEVQWRRTLDINLRAPADLTVASLGLLQTGGGGAVVHVASISGHIAQAGRWTYNSAKAGLLALTRAQALDLAPLGIRVNSVSPGWIWTEALDQAASGDRARWEPVWGAYAPLRRCGEASEVAEAIAFLGGPAASYVTGADLAVDGGYLAAGPEGSGALELQR